VTHATTGAGQTTPPEPEYPDRCRYCTRPIRDTGNGWADRHGWFRCERDTYHEPRPT
jgi:hypothetical protein